jgi:maltose/moltooligosaccharide transporter
MFANYNLIAAIAAFTSIIANIQVENSLILPSLVCGGLGLISIYFIQEPTLQTVAANDRCWDRISILSVPYAMLSGLPS